MYGNYAPTVPMSIVTPEEGYYIKIIRGANNPFDIDDKITSMYPTRVIAYDLETHKELVSRKAETPPDIRKDNKTNNNTQER